MKRKKYLPFVIAVTLVAVIALPMPVFASVDGIGGGFSLWNLLDGLGGFFRDTINAIGSFFSNVVSAVKNAANAVLDALSGIGRIISDGIGYLLSGLKALFVPSKESFSRFRDDLLTTFDKKFGSVFSALDYLDARFKGLKAKNGLSDIFKVTFPVDSFLYGLSINLLDGASPVLSFIRVCTTGFCCLVTALICYHKVIDMVDK